MRLHRCALFLMRCCRASIWAPAKPCCISLQDIVPAKLSTLTFTNVLALVLALIVNVEYWKTALQWTVKITSRLVFPCYYSSWSLALWDIFPMKCFLNAQLLLPVPLPLPTPIHTTAPPILVNLLTWIQTVWKPHALPFFSWRDLPNTDSLELRGNATISKTGKTIFFDRQQTDVCSKYFIDYFDLERSDLCRDTVCEWLEVMHILKKRVS